MGGTRALSKSSNKAISEPVAPASRAPEAKTPFNPRLKSDPQVSKRANQRFANDLVDVTATHYSALWELLHGRKLTPNQVTSIRNQLRQTLRDEPELATMNGADRQEIAETFMLHSVVLVDAYRAVQSSGDRKLLAQ